MGGWSVAPVEAPEARIKATSAHPAWEGESVDLATNLGNSDWKGT